MASEPPDTRSSVKAKVVALLTGLSNEHAEQLLRVDPGADARSAISAALQAGSGFEHAEEIAFHLADWGWEAAFLVAVQLSPECFDAGEIRHGVESVLCHAPSHLAAAAVLSGQSVRDVFGVMLPGLLATPEAPLEFAELTRPDLLIDGHEPEQRVVHHGLSWERYLALDKIFGDDRPGPRFCYLDGDLEMVTTSVEHERIKSLLHGFIDECSERADVRLSPLGQATIRDPALKAGIEPDDSWYGARKEAPALVCEIALNRGGVDKLELYRRFAVPEVWFWRKGKLEVHALLTDGSAYERVSGGSRLLPGLDIALLERCVSITNWREARKAFRGGLKT